MHAQLSSGTRGIKLDRLCLHLCPYFEFALKALARLVFEQNDEKKFDYLTIEGF